MKGNFQKYVKSYLESINQQDYNTVNRTLSIFTDNDPVNW